MSRELIYRDDCDLNAPSLGRDEMLWDLIYECQMPDSLEMFNFARIVLEKAQAVIDTAPTITTDEYLAFKCPECNTVYIEYNDPQNSFCPVCGCGRKHEQEH